jgi:tripeptidyl-peptidase-1
MQFGARGTSIFMSSGDGGVGGTQSTNCTTFVPAFPSTCPFVTSIGGTTGFSPERAVDVSSGGFSNIFSTPAYQSSAISTYLAKQGSKYNGFFNPKGRGFPDISAQGTNIPIVLNGKLGTVGGTSASTPIVASIVALVNDRLIAAGKPPVGFLNPLIYSNGSSAFTDITSGNNPGCNTAGFSATTGWDPITGYGTPVFGKLRALFGV